MSALLPAWPLAGAAVGAALASAAAAAAVDRHPRWMRWSVFPLLTLSGLAVLALCAAVLGEGGAFQRELPLGLPWLRWHLRLDPLSAVFLGLIGLVTVGVSLYGPRYARHLLHGPYSGAALGIATGLFVAGLQILVLADDAFAFVIAWELMSVASYFLVAYEHHDSANRRAAFLYLLMAQVGAVLLMLCFGVLSGFSGGFGFDAMRGASLEPAWASLAFALGVLGFGMKAGLVPLHVWLPEAHPVAPSHISALMSGVMLKVAIYGFIRLAFDLLGEPLWGWGVALLVLGSVTALYGILYALVQTDLKRLLAYSSVENVGIVFIGLGLSLIFFATGAPELGALGLVAALYHAINHAAFKSLLFLGAGGILIASHERDLEHMGGLVRAMPASALFFLIGCLSIASLPPFNGFVSEWLTFQTALQATVLDSGVLRAVIPITAAMLALTAALSAACFVKLYGIAFLGQPRTRHVRHAREPGGGMLAAQGLLAAACILLGVAPTWVAGLLGGVSESLTGQGLVAATTQGWLWLTPVAPRVASYSAPLVVAGLLAALALWWLARWFFRRRRAGRPLARVEAWECGFGSLSPRMQYTATAFAMPFRQIFAPAFRLEETVQREMDEALPTRPARLGYRLAVLERVWHWFYRPVERGLYQAVRRVGRIQTGNLRHYLAYSFITLVTLLWLIS